MRWPNSISINIFRYMGTDPPREFGRSEADIICTFFNVLSPFLCGDEMLDGIVEMAKESSVSGYDFATMKPCDLEFVKCTGRTCTVPRTMTGFEWSSDAVKSLAGQGDLYARLRCDFSVSEVEEGKSVDSNSLSPVGESSTLSVATPTSHSPLAPTQSVAPSSLESRPSTSNVR